MLSTVVKISEILYSSDDKRAPKTILQLYNCTWMHHELYKCIFTRLHEITHARLFGSYLHALVVHSPLQYEVVCLRSVNTKNQERIFQQAKAIASATTNRKLENFIPSVMLRLQAKHLNGNLSSIFSALETEVKKAAKGIPEFKGTCVSSSFLSSRSYSWQVHLERISHYLVLGEGKWWERSIDSFSFFDGDRDPYLLVEGPALRSFRSTAIADVISTSKAAWNRIIAEKITLPLNSLREFDENGDLLSLRNVHENFEELDCSAIEPFAEDDVSMRDTHVDGIQVAPSHVITSTPIRDSSVTHHKELQFVSSSYSETHDGRR